MKKFLLSQLIIAATSLYFTENALAQNVFPGNACRAELASDASLFDPRTWALRRGNDGNGTKNIICPTHSVVGDDNMTVVIYGALGESATLTCYLTAFNVASGSLATVSDTENDGSGPFVINLSITNASADWFSIYCVTPDWIDISMYYVTSS